MKFAVMMLVCLSWILLPAIGLEASDLVSPGPQNPICEETVKSQEEALATLRAECLRLEEKIREMECTPAVSSDELMARNLQHLRELAANTRIQRNSMADFEKFVTWMSSSLSGYEKYIQAGSVVAGMARVLPIPYAGQASLLTKFVSQGVLSLNAASGSIATYLKASERYLTMVDAIDPKRPDGARISAAVRFADGELLGAMTDVQAKLRTSAEISASTLSFLETLDHYVGNTDEYWARTKAFVTRNESYKNDRSYLASSIEGLRNRAGAFNGKLALFEEMARKDLPIVKKLVAYDELRRDLEARAASRRDTMTASGGR